MPEATQARMKETIRWLQVEVIHATEERRVEVKDAMRKALAPKKDSVGGLIQALSIFGSLANDAEKPVEVEKA